jgi:hypothetical protein
MNRNKINQKIKALYNKNLKYNLLSKIQVMEILMIY